MGKKPQRHGWPEAKKLCRLNQNDIAMAKALGFGPDSLVRASPDPKQKWKLPVKYWIHELHFKRFGCVLGEEPLPEPPPQPERIEYDEEAARLYGEQVYWEEYYERNAEPRPGKRRPVARPAPQLEKAESPCPEDFPRITDDDVPF
jgi:hypothetical protein